MTLSYNRVQLYEGSVKKYRGKQRQGSTAGAASATSRVKVPEKLTEADGDSECERPGEPLSAPASASGPRPENASDGVALLQGSGIPPSTNAQSTSTGTTTSSGAHSSSPADSNTSTASSTKKEKLGSSSSDRRVGEPQAKIRRRRLFNLEHDSIPEPRDIYFFCHRSGSSRSQKTNGGTRSASESKSSHSLMPSAKESRQGNFTATECSTDPFN